MKRSFLTVLAAASVFAIGACAGEDDADIEPVEEVAPPPPPAPAPLPMDTTLPGDTTMPGDTMPTTTGL